MSDAYTIDKASVRTSFGRSAASYDAAAVMQQAVFRQMFERLDLVKLQPKRILDAGCGTGQGIVEFGKRYPQSQVIGLDIALPMLDFAKSKRSFRERWKNRQHFVGGDIEALPLVNHSVDLLWSNLAIQWCNDLDQVFDEFHRVLTVEGLLMFSTFGPDTLHELRAASQDQDEYTHVSRFLDMHDIGDALIRAGFSDPVLDVERIVLTYDDVFGLMRDLKQIGAHNATQGRPRGLRGKGFLQQLEAQYETFRKAGKLPATYEVVYGHAWKPKPRVVGDAHVMQFQPRKK